MLLQVRNVSTVISCTETQWENTIEKSKRRFKCRFGFGFGLKKMSSVANSTGELGAPDTENALKQQSNCWKPSSLLSNVHFRNTTKIAVQVLLLLTLFTFTFEPFLKL